MAFLFLKKKKEEAEPEPTNTAEKKSTEPEKKKKKSSVFSGVLRQPHITERAALLGEKGEYVFRVASSASKDAVKQAVEAQYGVQVIQVNMIKVPAKKIRLGRRQGIKQGYKKAVVKLQKGETLEVISR